MKKSQLKNIIKESLKELINNPKAIAEALKKPSPLNEQVQFYACCDTTALNYNPGCQTSSNCTCDNSSCVSVSQICSSVVSTNFANNMSNLGCGGLQQRHTLLSNKLGVVSTPGASLPGPGNWGTYDFSADNIGSGVQGTSHSNWQTQLQNKLACIDLYMQQNNC
jgi:hypothetical protein